VKKRSAGLTLVELLMALALSGVIGWAVTNVWLTSDKTYRAASDIADAQAGARVATVRLEGELRAASKSSVSVSGSPPDLALTFESLPPNGTGYQLISYYQRERTLYRASLSGGAPPQAIASDVESFEASMSTGEVSVGLDVEVNGRRASLGTRVRPRNP
jgi:prepilin-type N-terminal cleavage/methylation domain-containing protein